MQQPHHSERPSLPQPERRGFLKKAAAIILGTLSGLIPSFAGLAVFLDPLRRKGSAGHLIFVTNLESLPDDGAPRRFRIIADHSDAWNRTPHVPVGAVYLRKTGAKAVRAVNVVCPHAGGFVDYSEERKGFHCPLHNSSFALDGKIDDPKSPSPRGLDELEVEIRNGTEIWVKFENFLAGRHEKVPVS